MRYFVVLRCYGAVNDTWFGPAPFGDRWAVEEDGQYQCVGRPHGSMHSLAPGNDVANRGAAFGRHGTATTHELSRYAIPEGAEIESGPDAAYVIRSTDRVVLTRLSYHGVSGRIYVYETKIWIAGGAYLVRHGARPSIEPAGGSTRREVLDALAAEYGAMSVRIYDPAQPQLGGHELFPDREPVSY